MARDDGPARVPPAETTPRPTHVLGFFIYAGSGGPVFYRKVCLPGRTEMATLTIRVSVAALLACLTHPRALHEEDEARSAARRRQDQLPWQQQRVRIGTEEVPLGAEELYCNQLSWAY